jgi:toxin secretion/phage lysis holin
MWETVNKLVLAVFGCTFAAWLGHVWEVAFFAFALIILDYITGILAGRANEGLNSKRAYTGIRKKVGILCLLCLGFILESAFNGFIAYGFQFELPFALPIGLLVTVWIVILEAISILENVNRMGARVPVWLLKMLKRTYKDMEGKEQGK